MNQIARTQNLGFAVCRRTAPPAFRTQADNNNIRVTCRPTPRHMPKSNSILLVYSMTVNTLPPEAPDMLERSSIVVHVHYLN